MIMEQESGISSDLLIVILTSSISISNTSLANVQEAAAVTSSSLEVENFDRNGENSEK